MWNSINTGRVLILTPSKVRLTLMSVLCSRALAGLINGGAGSQRHGEAFPVCDTATVYSKDFLLPCGATINCNCRAVLVSSSYPSVNKVCLHSRLYQTTQHCSARHSRAWQCCWALGVSIHLQWEPSCKSGFSGGLSATRGSTAVAIHLTFDPVFGCSVFLWRINASHDSCFSFRILHSTNRALLSTKSGGETKRLALFRSQQESQC